MASFSLSASSQESSDLVYSLTSKATHAHSKSPDCRVDASAFKPREGNKQSGLTFQVQDCYDGPSVLLTSFLVGQKRFLSKTEKNPTTFFFRGNPRTPSVCFAYIIITFFFYFQEAHDWVAGQSAACTSLDRLSESSE